MNQRELTSLRLWSQGISRPLFTSPADVVSHLGAMQAQDYPGALWSMALRQPEATQAQVEDAIREGKIVRAWFMRGTLHFVAAPDVKWMLDLLTPRLLTGLPKRSQQFGLTDADLLKARKVIVKALEGGHALSRDAIYARLESAKISTASQRGYHILARFGLEQLICFGPHEEKQPTFVLLDEWVKAPRRMNKEEALAELALRYFRSHGPAPLSDFIGWSALTAGDAKHGLSLVGHELTSDTFQGKPHWFATPEGPVKTNFLSYLLPGFDEYVLGYKDRTAVLPAEFADRIVPGANGMFLPTLVRSGQIIGTWKRTPGQRETKVVLQSFTTVNPTSFSAPLRKYGHFLQQKVTVLPPPFP